MKIIFKYALLLFAVSTSSLASEWGAPTMPLEDIKAGMTGTARTVFYKDNIEEFGVEVIDVMHNFYPNLDIILVKLLGEEAEKNGVVSGMSGSPVYIDGKLIGALSYRFGQFMKEPIGGVMPIKYMMEIEEKNKTRDIKSARQDYLPEYIEAALIGADETFWSTVMSVPEPLQSTNTNLNIINSPLVFSGFQPEIVIQYDSYFKSMGFTTMVAGNAPATEDASTLEPGSAVSVVFLTGDLAIEATGTVTAVGDNKLLAFGHQLFNFGPIALPMAGARVYTTLPSLMGSSKMSSATGVLGTFLQDRMAGAFGDLTVSPKMIPIRFRMQSPFHETTEFDFELANDPAFNNMLPFYMRTALIQAAYSARLAGEQNSSHLTGAIHLTDGRSLELDDLFSSEQNFGFLAAGADAVSAADLVTSLMGNILVNDFTGPTVESVEMNLKTIPGYNYAIIESVWQDKTRVKPGEDITLSIQLRDEEGNRSKINRTIPIPKNISGRRVSVFVSSGSALTRYEVQLGRDKFVPDDFDDIVRILSERRKTQNLYIQVRALDNGLIVDGQEMLDVPPSIMNAMRTRSSGGVVKQLRDRPVHEEHVRMDNVIVGAKRLILTIETPQNATTSSARGDQAWYR